MPNEIAMEIEQMLVEAWDKYLHYYNKKVPVYPISWGFDEKEAKESHWICWNEYDLMFHIGRFFYEALEKKREEEREKEEKNFLNIEMHFEKSINKTNFKDYRFEDKLNQLKGNLEMKKGPKVDVIVGYEDKNSPFLLCAEMKCFHSASERYGESPIKKISDDIKKLKAIRDCGIAQRVVFMLFDDYYYCCPKKEIAGDIENELENIKKDEKIRVLSYNSQAKLDKYLKKRGLYGNSP